MVKIVHNITISIFEKLNEDEFEEKDKIVENISNFLFETNNIEELQKIGVKKEVEKIKPHNAFESNINIKKIIIEKQNTARKTIAKIYSNLPKKEQEFLIDSIDTRTDDSACTYLRFDEQEFEENNNIKLVDHGNCIHVKIKVAAYPSNKENAIKIMLNLLESKK